MNVRGFESGASSDVKARLLHRDGSYSHIKHPKAKAFSSQEFLIDLAENKASLEDIPETVPATAQKRARRKKTVSSLATGEYE